VKLLAAPLLCGTSCVLGTDVQVKVGTRLELVRIQIENPAVKELDEIVQIVLAAAAVGMRSGRRGFDCQTRTPAVVTADRQNDVAVILGESLGKVTGSCLDVEFRVETVVPGSAYAFLLGDLHEPLLARSANGSGIAATLLERKAREKDRWQAVQFAIFFKELEIGRADMEWARRVLERRL